MTTLKQARVFPGQGAQRLAMDTTVFSAYPELVEQAEDIAGFSIRGYFKYCPKEIFNNTAYVQPALYTLNALNYFNYVECYNQVPAFLAGHSLGEFNALHAAGVFDFVTGLHLVTQRGKIMSEVKSGSMAAILGLNVDEVREVLANNGYLGLTIANINSDLQIVISGVVEHVNAAEEIFYDYGAIKYVKLNVSGAFHSRMLNEASIRFYDFARELSYFPPQIPVIANLTARPYLSERVVNILQEQMTHPVLWREMIVYMRSQGVTDFVEIGGGTLLMDMVKNIAKDN